MKKTKKLVLSVEKSALSSNQQIMKPAKNCIQTESVCVTCD